jgi:hypothetical protein
MSNRWLRFVIALIALGVAGAAGYRLYQQQQRLAADLSSARATDSIAESALATIPEIKAALHAYVAEGQDFTFWATQASTLIDRLRSALLELDGPASAALTPLTESLDLADRLAAFEQRARDQVRLGQKWSAGEVVFTEARDVLDAMRGQVARARTHIGEQSGRTQAQIRREQVWLIVAGLGVLAFTMLLLVNPGRTEAPPVTLQAPTIESPDQFDSSARLVSRTPLKPTIDAIPAIAPVTPGTPASRAVAGKAITPDAVSIAEAASVCTELGRASQSIELTNLLDRAAKVLNASGVVVWMASADGRELYPAASAGYNEDLLARIGPIPRSGNNVTASAVRAGAPRTSSRVGQSAASLAVPLLTPLGAVGVFSAEVKGIASVDETRLAVARIFAAQLASLVGSKTTSTASAQDEAARAK